MTSPICGNPSFLKTLRQGSLIDRRGVKNMKFSKHPTIPMTSGARLKHNLLCVLFLGCLCLCLSNVGCTTTAGPTPEGNKSQIMKDYLTHVDKSDGIDQDEALLLARSQIIFRGKDTRYDINKPLISSEDEAWALTFSPINKTLGELLSAADLVIRVDKKDGRIDWLEQ